MRLRMFARLGRKSRRLVWGGALSGLLLAAGTTAIGDVSPEAKRARSQDDSFSLFASPTVQLRGNQLQCGLNNIGSVCTDVFDSPTGGGGFWPVGTPNQYIFNTGMQVAGIVDEDGGPWANDTTAAFFFDPKGTTQHGTALTNIYDSLNPDDILDWPDEAKIQIGDPLFQPVLWGRNAASQQDSWVKYWDGNPDKIAGRQHPLGIEVEQRSLAWNYPAGNESLIYFIYKFSNISDDPEFRRLNNSLFFGGDDVLPADGYNIKELYGAFATDMDVSDATENFSTAVLTFDLGLSYTGGFNAPEFSYTPDIFFPPFFTNAPGLIGIKYLRSPIRPGSEPPEEVGLTLFSANLNASFGFPDPQNDKQLWRYLSGKISPAQGDNPCNVEPEVVTADPNLTQRSVCFIFQESADTRFYQSSGPFSLSPEDPPATIVVAYIAAATVATMPNGDASGLLVNQSDSNANPPGDPSFHPNFESTRGCTPAQVAAGDPSVCTDYRPNNPVKPIERGAGWIGYVGDPPSGRVAGALESPDNKLDQFRVLTVPNSLLGRSLVAQSIFDSAFLLGFAPDGPAFYLVPGDNSVTVIWDESATETLGDPFFEVASDIDSPLYNPNYREFDVEGYRVWRGTNPGLLSLQAQWDKALSTFPDYTCETVAPDEDVGTERDGVPVVGYVGGETCAGSFPDDPVAERKINITMIFNNGADGGLPGAGAARLADGSAIGTAITHVIVDDVAGPSFPLNDEGIPFTFVDNTVTNNFTYFYAVSAFDVNSQASGPHTLRSAKVAQSVVPRSENSAFGVRFDATVVISGDDGVELDLTQSAVKPDADTGIFPGPQPPTNALDLLVIPSPAEVAGLLTSGQLLGRIDSVTAEDISFGCAVTGGNALGACLLVHMTFDNGLEVVQTEAEIARPVWSSFGEPSSVEGAPMGAGNYPYDDARLEEFGIPAGAGTGVAAGLAGTFDQTIDDPAFVGQRIRRWPDNRYQPGGNRWFDGTVEVTPDPTTFIRAGHIEGIDSVWAPIHHTSQGPGGTSDNYLAGSGQIQCWGYTLAILSRAADFQVTWGEGGTVTIRDITHNVPVDFKESPQSSYGFLNTDGNGNGVIDWNDFDFLDVIRQATTLTNTFCEGNADTRSVLETQAVIQPVFLGGGNPSAGDAMPATGNGFGLYINGERYIFLTDNLPAAGTVWTYRTYNGRLRAQDPMTFDPSSYELRGGGGSDRVPSIPGLQLTLDVVEAGHFKEGPFDLTEVHTVPDPYTTTSQYDLSPTTKQLMFVNLPSVATIRIYTLTGVLVDILNHDDPTGGGRAVWGLRNRNNQFVASGVYFFHVVTPEGDEHVGKFTVVNFGGTN